jgi:Mn2+/Fe2+ NRAMP family transporter
VRVIAAFLIAPALAITCMCVLFSGQPYKDALVVSLMIAYLTYPFVLVIGLPLFWLLYSKQWLGLKACLLAALICASIAFMFMLSPLDAQERLRQIQSQGLFIVATALLGGVLFWWIGVRHNRALNQPGRRDYAAAP